MNPIPWLGTLGAFTRQWLSDWGYGARLLWRLFSLSGVVLKRFGLVRDQVHFLGNYSLAIIAVSGLFVGFVLSLQGYYTLQRYGSAEALGLLVALSLVRELGPVVSALLFAGRAGASLTAEIVLMRAIERLGDDGGRSDSAHFGPAFLGRHHRFALVGGGFQRSGYFGRVWCRGVADWGGRRFLLESDARRC